MNNVHVKKLWDDHGLRVYVNSTRHFSSFTPIPGLSEGDENNEPDEVEQQLRFEIEDEKAK